MVKYDMIESRSENIIEMKKGEGGFFKFFPAVAVMAVWTAMFALLNLLASFMLPLVENFVALTSVSAILLIMFISQMLASVITFFVLMPLFKVKTVDQEPLRGSKIRRTFLVYVSTYALMYLLSYTLVLIFSAIDMLPTTGYGMIIPDEQQAQDTFTMIMYFIGPTIGAGVAEELIYRRTMIPLMEKRGMAPFTAAFTSALLFALGHLPNDLINGNLTGGITHVSGVFLLGMALGMVYVITRNAIYPMVFHGIANLWSFLGPLVLLSGSGLWLSMYVAVIWIILGGGIISAIYILIQYLRKRDYQWIQLAKQKSTVKLKAGFTGFQVLGIGVFLSMLSMEIILSYMVEGGFNYYLALAIINIVYGTILVVFLVLGHKSIKKEGLQTTKKEGIAK